MAYCNITTDLTDIYPQLNSFQELIILDSGWYATSGQTNTYEKRNIGQVNMVFDDGVMLVLKTSIATVEATAGTFWYDADNDILYIHAYDSDDMTTASITITMGEDWDAFLTYMRNRAMMHVDAYLNTRYEVPILPRADKTHATSDKYDFDLMRATALYTCWLIAQRRNPGFAMAKAWLMECENENLDEAPKGILPKYRDGELSMQNQITPNEQGRWEGPYANSSNTVEEGPILRGQYYGTMLQRWRIQVDGGGVPGTGTFKVSYDGGTTWDLTTQDMRDASDDEVRMSITSGIWVEWPLAITWVDGEYWDFVMHPENEVETGVAVIGSVEAWR